MGFDAKAGMFALNVVPGNQAIAGVGFAPKVVLFFPTDNTLDGISVDSYQDFGVGISSSDRFACTSTDEDGQDPTDGTHEGITTKCILHNNPGLASSDYDADFVSLDPGGFTIDITTAPAVAKRVGYLALGGDDLTNVATGNFIADNALGSQPVAGVGFQPDAVIFASYGVNGADDVRDDGQFGLGFAVSPTSCAALGAGSDSGEAASDTGRQQRTTSCIYVPSRTGAVEGEATLESFDPDGFTVDWTDATFKAIHFLCLKGGEYAIGNLSTRIAIGNITETGVGFRPIAGMFASFCNAKDAGKIDSWNISVGAATSSSQRFVTGSTSEDGQAPSDCDSFQDDGLIYQHYDYDQNVLGAIDFVSWNNDGFMLNQTDADPDTNQMIYLVMGVPPSVEGYAWIF